MKNAASRGSFIPRFSYIANKAFTYGMDCAGEMRSICMLRDYVKQR